jgi:hypothetical protein
MNAKFGWLIVGAVALTGALGFFSPRRASSLLKAEIIRGRAAGQALTVARGEHDRLLAVQLTAAEIESAAANREAIQAAHAEVEALRKKLEATVRAEAGKPATAVERFAVGRSVPAAEWSNAGYATPTAALETALWAGAGGDFEVLAKSIMLIDYRTQKEAQALFASLPESMRGKFASPEQVIAFLTVKDVPLGAVQVRRATDLAGWPMGPAQQVQILETQADGKQKDASLVLVNPGGGWKLVVNQAVVAKYAAQLKELDSLAGGK